MADPHDDVARGADVTTQLPLPTQGRSPASEVPQPSEPVTPAVPDAPVTPAVPDPGTPADPEEPATVPVPDEPVTPIVPDPEPGPDGA
jgi:hypothetical protein